MFNFFCIISLLSESFCFHGALGSSTIAFSPSETSATRFLLNFSFLFCISPFLLLLFLTLHLFLTSPFINSSVLPSIIIPLLLFQLHIPSTKTSATVFSAKIELFSAFSAWSAIPIQHISILTAVWQEQHFLAMSNLQEESSLFCFNQCLIFFIRK